MARAGEVEPSELPRTLDIIIEQTARIAATIRQVLDLARQQPPNRSPLDLSSLIESTRELLLPLASKKSIEVRVEQLFEQSPGPGAGDPFAAPPAKEGGTPG